MRPLSEFPVAALNRVPITLVRSGPPPGEGRGGGRLGGLRGGGTRSFSGGGGWLFFLDWQHTVPFWQEFVSGMMVQTADIIWGMQTPGHSFFLGDGGGGGLLDDEDGLLSSTLRVMQHLPLPGHLTERSISSQSSAKKPVTQVPLHRLLFDGLGGFGFLVVFLLGLGAT